MSLAHELRVLDLESQIELLDRLRLLTRFGSNLTNITGDKNSGKSWIAQRYLEAWAQDKNQSLVMCHANQTDAQKRTILLNQIVPNPLFNENDSIADSFSRMIEDNPCDVVIVIDDAQLLSEALLAELWTLVLQAQVNPQWSINVVLFTAGNGLDNVLSRLSYGQETKPLSLEVEPLSDKEVEMFIELLVLKYVPGEDEKRKVRNKVKKTPPLPGSLMALGESKVEKRIIIRSIIGSPMKIAALVLILLLLILSGYFWFFSQSGPTIEESTNIDGQPVEQTVIPTINTDEDGRSTVSVNGDNIDQGMVDETGAVDDSSSLPPAITNSSATVGQSDDGQRVVVPSVVVDALLEGDTSNSQIIDDAVLKAQLEQAPPVAETEFERDEGAPPLITFSFSKQELMAVSDRNYTLQIAALQSLSETQNFIVKYGIDKDVRIYPTNRGNTQWFIVTYKDFTTIQEARNARAELPQAVQDLEPWAKSMLQVHREIERAN
ncbi:AAA family ATPase [Vibrio algarum]|uniref:AAA family ATPase n=1 Tax=Vibrio algarum TaxID=3020714 RepID=A0ABT4YLD6_9VIBR|nr:AAA family ATPase [Vibrio sp. KJ40-1]MDB1122362.1 AAA family ATPase [Vibrio sp. KJ40-1]